MKKHLSLIAGIIAVILAILVALFLKFKAPSTRPEISDFKFPILSPDEFNAYMLERLGKDGFVWKDLNGDKTFILKDGSVDVKELSGRRLKDFVVPSGNFYYFTTKFEEFYAPLIEEIRQKKVAAELELTTYEPMVTNVGETLRQFPEVTAEELENYKEGISKLLEIAPIMHSLYLYQIGGDAEDAKLAATENDKELIKRYGHPWCLSDNSELCVAIPTFKKRGSETIPPDVPCQEANKIGSPFEVVSRDKDGNLIPIPYNTFWEKELKEAAEKAREAAGIFEKIPREAVLAKHLKDLADAFLSKEPYPYATSDASWAESLTSDSLLFVRIGPDEVGGDSVGDPCESKARFHFNLGIKNKSVREMVAKLEPELPRLETMFAELIGDPQNYQPRQLSILLPVFVDVIYANGDDIGGPGGTNVGQTLPNWCGSDGKGECTHGTMVYLNKTIKSYSRALMEKYIMPLFSEDVRGMFDENANIMSVVYHELFHNLGPMYKLKKPGSEATYGDTLVAASGESWKVPIEELKAQTGAMFMATVFFEDAKQKLNSGQITEEEFRKAEEEYKGEIMRDLAWCMRMIMRASREDMNYTTRNPYARLAAVQIGFLSQHKALVFDDKQGVWKVDFSKMPEAIRALMKRTGELYAKADANQIEEFFLYYMRGDGEKLLHRKRILEVAGKMPTTLFEYKVTF